MRTVPQSITDTWLGGEYTGDRRPMARVTIQRMQIQLAKLDPERLFASALFGQADIPRELPNVKSVNWDRSVGSDVASCTIVFYNTTPLELGDTPPTSGDFDLPGYYTYNYGATSWSTSRWGHTVNQWQDYLIPDRLIRTYEGFGFDRNVAPEVDGNLVQTGVWLIDDVEYSSDGLITVNCRDVGRLLLDHIIFPPVIPLARYPLEWDPYHDVDNPDVVTTTGTTFRPTYGSDSGIPYYGRNGLIHGHKPSHAFDTSNTTYWLSVGNALPNASYSYEYIEGNCGGKTVSAVKATVLGGPYRVYLSVKIKGVWQGSKTIPYDPNNPVSAPNGANIKYSTVKNVGRDGTATFTLSHPVANVDAVRLTFTGLWNSGIGPYKYRAGVRDIQCSSQKTVTKDGGTHVEGNFGDYTHIVKYLLACGGFYWPRNANAYFTYSNGFKLPNQPSTDDAFLTKGRIWGDLEMSQVATFENTKLQSTIWDKKTLMDGIAYVRDVLGFLFFIDEGGGAVFRLPNVFSLGNFKGLASASAGYVSDVITIDERQTLIGLKAKISSKNQREWFMVSNETGLIGGAAAGYDPVKPASGMRRLALVTDKNYGKNDEAKRTAEMMAIQGAFLYRTNTLTIVANPAIQIDDQVRVYERVTGEGFYHYVRGISSSNDLESGEWTYNLTTNWLGEEPYAKWAFDPAALSTATQQFLAALMGKRTI